ncbi:MAG: TetR/AcrR family transcriptional regulator [Actinomycetota bacterium]
MGHKYTKDELLVGALAVASTDGLSQVTFGRVARHLGVSDRVVVYYFESKDVLITEVVLAMGAELQQSLASAFDTPAADHVELTRAAWPLLSSGRSDDVFALFFEANGLAVAGREPYATLVPQLVAAWIEWAAGFVEGDDDHRRAEAETAVAVIDGLLLLRLLVGPDAADRAARRFGIA